MTLVANKIEKDQNRKVTKEQGELMAEQYGIRYFETSSKHNIGLDDAFEDVIEQAYKSRFLN